MLPPPVVLNNLSPLSAALLHVGTRSSDRPSLGQVVLSDYRTRFSGLWVKRHLLGWTTKSVVGKSHKQEDCTDLVKGPFLDYLAVIVTEIVVDQLAGLRSSLAFGMYDLHSVKALASVIICHSVWRGGRDGRPQFLFSVVILPIPSFKKSHFHGFTSILTTRPSGSVTWTCGVWCGPGWIIVSGSCQS